ncbi:peptide/nickel transport system substrate-binding protein [Desulfatibacillum alkenivorans DSM 16219]|jgi:peptide/nickel transport system substrate-binding protein|uniref:Peptide/nickel transport system substrate-binding protein n=1 Tax=Desulfatibacillum alkenivorans DSM 16219 TaxID=1121393 RepID=A0A1M6WVC0_9BACT|nr:ABC transporter substrate-binding protein [Desulfatibacillum alkenivorans]SHK97596.1 peptide/nickel transport system substrate-binding protein [Desulfatibacillum alkenivorans DSM 16219]
MKKILIAACLALCIVLAFGATAQAKTLKLAMDADPVSLDPHVQLSGGMLQYSHMVFDPLVRWTKDMQIEPRLAEKWERLDDLTMRFYLRKGVKFHSGAEFTAKDVVFTIDRLKKSQDYKALFEPFTGALAVSDYVVDLKTTKPYPLVLNMATYVFPMDSAFYTGTDEKGQPKDAIVKIGPSFALTNESGTGPYKVTFREQGVKNVFTRFADYWDKASPGNADEIVLTPIKNDATRVAALLSGDVDFIMPVPPQDYERIRKESGVQLVTMAGSRIITVQLNQKRRPEFANRKVRQAIVYAINNEGIVKKIMKGEALAAGQQGPMGFAGYDPALVPRYDLEKAKTLMKEAGFENGFSCSMIAPNNRYVNDEKIAEAIVSMLAKINIKVNLKTMPKAQYWDEFDAQAADIQMIGWHSDTEDSANYTEFLCMCPNKDTGYGQYNSGNYCNPQVDELVLDSQSETDPAKRSQILKQVERLLYDDAAYVPLHWQNLSWAGKSNLDIDPIVNVMNFPYFGDLVIK